MAHIIYPAPISNLLLDLSAHKVYVVGGFIRDTLLNRYTPDIDLVTPDPLPVFLPTIEALSKRPYVIERYHAVMFSFMGHKATLTRLRRDTACDGRQAEVEFVPVLREDVWRRDFTINALYADVEGNVIDYVGGVEDLQQQHVRFIGDPTKRIAEDVLRILRYVRFCSLFETPMDEAILTIALPHMPALRDLPRDRLNYEIKRTLKLPFGKRNWEIFTERCGEI